MQTSFWQFKIETDRSLKKIIRFMENPKHVKELYQKANQRILQYFDFNKMIEPYIQLYHKDKLQGKISAVLPLWFTLLSINK
jgi:hypothetical protein